MGKNSLYLMVAYFAFHLKDRSMTNRIGPRGNIKLRAGGVFLVIFVCTLCSGAVMAYAQADGNVSHVVPPGKTVYEAYNSYTEGDCPFIISIPHDGTLEPEGALRRTKENTRAARFVTARDTRTKDLGLAVARKFYEKTGKHPYVVYTDARRTVVDQNRALAGAVPMGEGGELHPVNREIYETYQGFLVKARADLMTKFPVGLLIDFHAHAHGKRNPNWKRVEIGYCIGREDLALAADVWDNGGVELKNSPKNRISIRNAIRRSPDLRISDLLFGPYSYGELLYNGGQGLPCMPRGDERYPLAAGQPGNPAPQAEPYFNGGYISRTYGSGDQSLEGGESRIDAIQLEFHGEARLPDQIETTADKVVDATIRYLEKFYGFKVP